MADEQFDTLQLVGRHVPDYSTETDAAGHKTQVELPGSYEVGFQKDGVFRVLYTLKAAGLFADIQRAQDTEGGQGS